MLLPVLAVGFGSPAAHAQNTFRVYAGLAPTTYSIAFDNNGPTGYTNKTAKADYLATNVGFSWISPQRIYVDLSLQRSGSATHDLWKDATGGNPPGPEQDFSHDSEVLTAGYIHVLSQGMTVSGFGGYRHGKTTLAAPLGGTVPAGVITWSKDFFDSRGVFFGAAWGMPALGGSVSVSGALALMGGKWTDDVAFSSEADSTVGFSLNASYTYRFAQAWGVTADYRFQTYNYAFNQNSAVFLPYDVTEKINSIGARVSYQF
jgi:hypothetical protein